MNNILQNHVIGNGVEYLPQYLQAFQQIPPAGCYDRKLQLNLYNTAVYNVHYSLPQLLIPLMHYYSNLTNTTTKAPKGVVLHHKSSKTTRIRREPKPILYSYFTACK